MGKCCFSVPARIVNISKNVSVNEGENVNLYCLAVGRPEPTVTWKDQKCKPLFFVCFFSDPDVSCSHLYLYLPVYRRSSLPVKVFTFVPPAFQPHQHSACVHIRILRPCVIVLKSSYLVCLRLKLVLSNFPVSQCFDPNSHPL